VLNEREALTYVGARYAIVVRRRAQAGRGPDGALPGNKDGTRPWNRSGRTAASIGYVVKQASKGHWMVTIRPIGQLVDRDVKAVRMKAAARQKTLRAAAALGPPIVPRPGGRKARKIQVRPVDSYAAVAAVLSVRDKRTGSTRGIYRVMAASVAEEAVVARELQNVLKVDLASDSGRR